MPAAVRSWFHEIIVIILTIEVFLITASKNKAASNNGGAGYLEESSSSSESSENADMESVLLGRGLLTGRSDHKSCEFYSHSSEKRCQETKGCKWIKNDIACVDEDKWPDTCKPGGHKSSESKESKESSESAENCVGGDRCSNCRVPECPESLFDGYCGRVTYYPTFYYHNGRLCKNTKQRGNCEIENVRWAANLNGNSLTDSNGIYYTAERSLHWSDKRDKYGIKKCGQYSHGNANGEKVKIIGANEKDHNLFDTFVYTDRNKCSHSRVNFGYNIKIPHCGKYEIVFKLVNCYKDAKKSHFWNILMNGQTILGNVHVVPSLVKNCQVLQVIINFRVRDTGPPKHDLQVVFPSSKHCVDLDSYYGMELMFTCDCDCRGDYVHPEISAIYIAKFGKKWKEPKRRKKWSIWSWFG